MIHIPLTEQIACNLSGCLLMFPSFIYLRTKYNKIVTFIGFMFANYLLNHLASIYAAMNPQGKNLWITVVMDAMFVIASVLLFEGKTSDKILFPTTCLFCLTLSAFLSTIPASFLSIDTTTFKGLFLISISITLTHSIFVNLFVRFKRKNKNETKTKTVTLFLIITLLGQYLLIILCMVNNMHSPSQVYKYTRESVDISTFLVFVVFCIVVDVGMFIIAHSALNYNRLESKRILSEFQNNAINKNIERAYSESMQLKATLNKCIQIINRTSQLLENGKCSVAIDEFNCISSVLDSPETKKYCENPLVNIILLNKLSKTNDDGIQTCVTVAIPVKVGMADLDLCRVFSNLTDNALKALDNCHTSTKYLSVSAIVNDGYLTIRYENSVNKDGNAFATTSTGLGHKILLDIASKYDGHFYSERTREGNYLSLFTARVE